MSYNITFQVEYGMIIISLMLLCDFVNIIPLEFQNISEIAPLVSKNAITHRP